MVWKPSSKIISHRISEMHIPPTKLELLKAIKICDILNPSFQGIAGDTCYENQDIRQLKS